MANGILKVGEITTSSGSGNITIGSGVTLQSNTPAFRATEGDQSLSNSAATKLTFNTVDFDTDSAFSTSTYRFTIPTGKAGKYYFETYLEIPGIDDGEYGQIYLRVNDTTSYNVVRVYMSGTNQIFRQVCSSILNLNVGDFVEAYAYQNSGGSQTAVSIYFSGFRIGA